MVWLVGGENNYDVVDCCVEVIYARKTDAMLYLIQLIMFLIENCRESSS